MTTCCVFSIHKQSIIRGEIYSLVSFLVVKLMILSSIFGALVLLVTIIVAVVCVKKKAKPNTVMSLNNLVEENEMQDIEENDEDELFSKF